MIASFYFLNIYFTILHLDCPIIRQRCLIIGQFSFCDILVNYLIIKKKLVLARRLPLYRKIMNDNEKNRIIHRIDGFGKLGGRSAGGDGNSYGC